MTQVDKKPLDIRHIVADAVEQVMPLAVTRGHKLVLELSPNP